MYLAAREGEQLPRQLRGAASGTVDLLHLAPARISGRQPAQEQLAVAVDRRQQVVEVVGHPTGQPAHRLHLLRLAQLLFERALHRHVAQRAPVGNHLALAIEHRGGGLEHPAAIAVHRAEVALELLDEPLLTHQGRETFAPRRLPVEIVRRRRQRLLTRREAEEAHPGGVEIEHLAGRGADVDGVPRLLEQAPVALLGSPERPGRLLTFGDVADIEDERSHRRMREQVPAAHLQAAELAVAMPDLQLAHEIALRFAGEAPEVAPRRVELRGMDPLEDRTPHPLARIETEYLRGGRALVEDGAVRRDQDDEVGALLDEGAKMLFAPLQRLGVEQAAESGGDVQRHHAADVHVPGPAAVRPRPVGHELPEQPVVTGEGEEGEGADPLPDDLGAQRRIEVAIPDIGDHDRLGVGLRRRPRGVAIGRRAVLVGKAAPGHEVGAIVLTEEEDRGVVGLEERAHPRERRLVDLFAPLGAVELLDEGRQTVQLIRAEKGRRERVANCFRISAHGIPPMVFHSIREPLAPCLLPLPACVKAAASPLPDPVSRS